MSSKPQLRGEAPDLGQGVWENSVGSSRKEACRIRGELERYEVKHRRTLEQQEGDLDSMDSYWMTDRITAMNLSEDSCYTHRMDVCRTTAQAT